MEKVAAASKICGSSVQQRLASVPLLYTFRRCPYAIRARLALLSAQIQVETFEVDLKHKPDAMLRLSAKGTVPVLLLEDSQVIDESLDIMQWALQQNDPEAWLLTKDDFSDALIVENDGTFKQALDRYKYPQRFFAGNCEQAGKQARDEALDFAETLNRLLKKNHYLAGRNCGYSDMAIFPFIRQFANVDIAWFESLPMKPLQNWLRQLLDSSGFKWVMQKNRTLLLP